MEANRERTTEDLNDLGFGAKVAEQTRQRLLNRDGSFNVERTGFSYFKSLSLYHFLLEMSWTRFYASAAVYYLGINVVFGLLYTLLGPGAIDGAGGTTTMGRLADGFFFSVQTMTTVGYGHLSPGTTAASILSTIELFLGFLTFALAARLRRR